MESKNQTKTPAGAGAGGGTGRERIIDQLRIDADFEQFRALSVQSFGDNVNQDIAMYRWYFDQNPYNPPDGTMMYVMRERACSADEQTAQSTPQIIASDGLIPFQLSLAGRRVTAAHSVKSMTAPTHMRQGIFRTMTQHSLEQAKTHGVSVVVGLANKSSYPAYEKFGWGTLFEKEVYIRPIHIRRALKKRLKLGFVAWLGEAMYQLVERARRGRIAPRTKYTVQMHDSIPHTAPDCFERFEHKYPVTTVRSYEYLHYRYDMRPDVSYRTITIHAPGSEEAAGFAVLRVVDLAASRMVSVAENFTDPDDHEAIRMLLHAIVSFAVEHRADYVVAASGQFGAYTECFRRCGFRRNKHPLINNMMIGTSLDDTVALSALVGHELWHMTQGDGETELDF